MKPVSRFNNNSKNNHKFEDVKQSENRTSFNPQVECFNTKNYFLEASLREKSLVTSNIFKNYIEEKHTQEFDEKKLKEKYGVGMNLSKSNLLTSDKNSNDIKKVDTFVNDFDKFYNDRNKQNIIKKISKEKNDKEFLMNLSRNKKQKIEKDFSEKSYDDFVHGFAVNSIQSPSIGNANYYLNGKLKI